MTTAEIGTYAGIAATLGAPTAAFAAKWVIKTYLYWAKVDVHDEEIKILRGVSSHPKNPPHDE